ncbi:hypothetical protein HMN09_01365800 [Mycena chlorophos]|uniref:Uncharacterized protein n=1 Tax=Mycena chlorophos TaxID=658473 RepID=A0A8H6VPG5_MYCCL|nr:hypothetical protein HMN09_01365800 [Mycena chlorophos]
MVPHLPPELLALVVSKVHDRDTLQSASLASTTLREPSQKKLFVSITLTFGGSRHTFSAALVLLDANPRLATFINRVTFDIHDRARADTDAASTIFIVLSRLRQVTHISILSEDAELFDLQSWHDLPTQALSPILEFVRRQRGTLRRLYIHDVKNMPCEPPTRPESVPTQRRLSAELACSITWKSSSLLSSTLVTSCPELRISGVHPEEAGTLGDSDAQESTGTLSRLEANTFDLKHSAEDPPLHQFLISYVRNLRVLVLTSHDREENSDEGGDYLHVPHTLLAVVAQSLVSLSIDFRYYTFHDDDICLPNMPRLQYLDLRSHLFRLDINTWIGTFPLLTLLVNTPSTRLQVLEKLTLQTNTSRYTDRTGHGPASIFVVLNDVLMRRMDDILADHLSGDGRRAPLLHWSLRFRDQESSGRQPRYGEIALDEVIEAIKNAGPRHAGRRRHG